MHPALEEEYKEAEGGDDANSGLYRTKQMYEFLDQLMEQIPGFDGYDANLLDETPEPRDTAIEIIDDGGVAIARHFYKTEEGTQTLQRLNAAKYSRYFALAGIDAMGRQKRRRGFNDPTMWAARTDADVVSDIKYENKDDCASCVNNDNGKRVFEAKWSYAIPLEIVYMNPLTHWNPYEIVRVADKEVWDGINGGRSGEESDPFENSSPIGANYLLPAEMTVRGRKDESVFVKDTDGTKRQVVPS